jgi:hypothetical protein
MAHSTLPSVLKNDANFDKKNYEHNKIISDQPYDKIEKGVNKLHKRGFMTGI